ncbi:MAG: DMT family transporter [Cyanobacteriota bacterium]
MEWLYLGIFPVAIAYLYWSYVLSQIPAGRASSFLNIVPVLATVMGFIGLEELPTSISIFGGAIVILGVLIVNVLGKKLAKYPNKQVKVTR